YELSLSTVSMTKPIAGCPEGQLPHQEVRCKPAGQSLIYARSDSRPHTSRREIRVKVTGYGFSAEVYNRTFGPWQRTIPERMGCGMSLNFRVLRIRLQQLLGVLDYGIRDPAAAQHARQ